MKNKRIPIKREKSCNLCIRHSKLIKIHRKDSEINFRFCVTRSMDKKIDDIELITAEELRQKCQKAKCSQFAN